jgi:hypothetical protein
MGGSYTFRGLDFASEREFLAVLVQLYSFICLGEYTMRTQ